MPPPTNRMACGERTTTDRPGWGHSIFRRWPFYPVMPGLSGPSGREAQRGGVTRCVGTGRMDRVERDRLARIYRSFTLHSGPPRSIAASWLTRRTVAQETYTDTYPKSRGTSCRDVLAAVAG